MKRHLTPLITLLLLAACSDLPLEPAAGVPESRAPGKFLSEVHCAANLARRSLSCSAAGEVQQDLIIGGQNLYVKLTSRNVAYNPADSTFLADVDVENLMAQVFGSPDGVAVTGIRVFFAQQPAVTSGTGTVTVDNEDGTATFLGPSQPYFAYPEALNNGDVSLAKTWRFKIDPGVNQFAFTVYVSGALPHESSLLLFQPSFTSSRPFLGIWGVSAEEVFAVGWFGWVARRTGGSWISDPDASPQHLRDVWGSSASDVFAVGDAGAIVHWDGTAWSEMTSSLTCPCQNFSGVWVAGPSDVFAVGSGGIITHYDGTAWTVQDTLPVALFGVWGAGPSDVFAAGNDGAIFHYNGTSWTQMVSGLEGMGAFVNAVWGLSGTDVYAATSTGLLHYNGSGWSPLPVPNPVTGEHFSVWGTSTNNLFTANNFGLWHFDGSTWAEIDANGAVDELWGAGPLTLFANTNNHIFRGSR